MPSSADLLDRGLDFKARADIVTRSPRLDDPHDRSHKKEAPHSCDARRYRVRFRAPGPSR
jgi:hypothetical protein